MRTQKGFTLIELLVVIAIIAILAALLFPVFAQARSKARAVRCVSNLRQLSMGIHQYMQDWDGELPEFHDLGRSPEEFLSFRWHGHLMPYLKNREILHCPADNVENGLRAVPTALPPAMHRWADHPLMPRLSYGYNFWIQQRSELTVARAADTLLIADCAASQCADAVRLIRGTATSCYAYANGTQPVDEMSPLTGILGQERHSGGSNVAFFDGHVKFIAAGQFRKRQEGGNCFEYPLVDPRCQPWQ